MSTQVLKEKYPVSPLRRITLRITSIVILLFATVLLLEVCLRILPVFLPQPLQSVLKEAQRIPLSNLRTYYGIRILLPPLDKNEVVFVGDSFPFGTYVRSSDRFPEVFGKLTGLQVANLGIGSQSPPAYNRMVEISARYQPRHVYYCVFANDFLIGELSEELTHLSRQRAFQPTNLDQTLFIEKETRAEKMYGWRKYLSNLFVSFQVYKLFDQPLHVTNTQKQEYTLDGHYYSFVTREFWDKQLSYDSLAVSHSVQQIARLANAANDYCQQMGTTFGVVLLPSKEMVYAPLLPPEVRQKVHDDSYDCTYDALMAALTLNHIPCFNMTDALREAAAKGEQLYFSIDGHFNEAGHRQTAETLAKHFAFQPSK